jgi:LysR family transcriptional regulator, nitrogen assimilation regulatory protein
MPSISDRWLVVEPKLKTASLDLRPLYYFVQVASLGSFSRAAAALSVGQPVISRFVKRLEDDFQVQLFHRHGRGVQLTEAGDKLLAHGRAILRNLSQAEAEVIALRGMPVGSVCIAMPPLFGDVLAVELTRQLRTDLPLVSFQIREGYVADVLDWLGAGLIDIGVMFNAPNIATLNINEVATDQLHLVGTSGSLDRIPGREIPVARLADLPLILPPHPHRLRAIIEQLAHDGGIALKVEVEVTGTVTLVELVRAGVGYTVLPSFLLRGEVREGRLQSWPLVEPVVRPTLFVATSMQRPHTLATKIALRKTLALLKVGRSVEARNVSC